MIRSTQITFCRFAGTWLQGFFKRKGKGGWAAARQHFFSVSLDSAFPRDAISHMNILSNGCLCFPKGWNCVKDCRQSLPTNSSTVASCRQFATMHLAPLLTDQLCKQTPAQPDAWLNCIFFSHGPSPSPLPLSGLTLLPMDPLPSNSYSGDISSPDRDYTPAIGPLARRWVGICPCTMHPSQIFHRFAITLHGAQPSHNLTTSKTPQARGLLHNLAPLVKQLVPGNDLLRRRPGLQLSSAVPRGCWRGRAQDVPTGHVLRLLSAGGGHLPATQGQG